jgi:hypothetical protein
MIRVVSNASGRRLCGICDAPADVRRFVDAELTATPRRKTLRELQKECAFSKATLSRHANRCLPKHAAAYHRDVGRVGLGDGRPVPLWPPETLIGPDAFDASKLVGYQSVSIVWTLVAKFRYAPEDIAKIRDYFAEHGTLEDAPPLKPEHLPELRSIIRNNQSAAGRPSTALAATRLRPDELPLEVSFDPPGKYAAFEPPSNVETNLQELPAFEFPSMA